MPAKKMLWLLPLFILASCGVEDEPRYGNAPSSVASAIAESADSITGELAATPAADRKIIRNVDFHCKVPNVLNAVTLLEKQVKAAGGMIAGSHIDNSSGEMRTIAYKPDSLKQVQVYHTTATMVLRVPAAMLDSVVSLIPTVSGFVETRTLSQQDVTLKYLSNHLLNKPEETHSKVSRGNQQAADSKDVIEIEKNEDARREHTINRYIENLRITDDVAYATLSVQFTQPDQTLVQIIANPDYIMTVPFATRCSVAMQGGLELVSGIIIGLLSIWPLLLIMSIGLFTGFMVVKQRRKLSGSHQDRL